MKEYLKNTTRFPYARQPAINIEYAGDILLKAAFRLKGVCSIWHKNEPIKHENNKNVFDKYVVSE
jgi:hypothetical protein